jgi:hypothetical protein
MPRYRVYATEEGRSTRAVSVDYIANSADEARYMYNTWQAFEDYSVDDYDFDMTEQHVDDVQLVDD